IDVRIRERHALECRIASHSDRQTDSGKYEPQSNGLYHAVGETTARDEPLVTTFETRDSRNLHISRVPHRAVHILGSSIIVKAMLTRRALKCRREQVLFQINVTGPTRPGYPSQGLQTAYWVA